MSAGDRTENGQTLGFWLRERDHARPLLSVVVPVFNEQACLFDLHTRLDAVLQTLGDSYEIVFVDDGSRDQSLEMIQRLHEMNPAVGYYSFSRNFGHESATSCGLENATGQTVVLIDADLQDPPELIPDMLESWKQGFDMVYAQRRSRDGETAFTKFTSHLFYRMFSRLTRVEMPVDTGDFRLMDRAVVDAFSEMPERNRYVRGMISWTGFKQTAIKYTREKRHAGVTKYNFFRRLNLAIDAICGMSNAPLRWITYVGGLLTTCSMGIGLVIGVHQLATRGGVSATTLLSMGMFVLGGIQLLTLGVLGEYIGRIYIETQSRPPYLVAHKGLPKQSSNSQRRLRATA